MKQNFNLIYNIELPINYRTIVEQKRKKCRVFELSQATATGIKMCKKLNYYIRIQNFQIASNFKEANNLPDFLRFGFFLDTCFLSPVPETFFLSGLLIS